MIVDILRVHPAVIVGGVLYENSFDMPPEIFLRELRKRATGAIPAYALIKVFDVEADEDDRELTFIARPGTEAYGRRVIGGGDAAVVKITVKIG